MPASLLMIKLDNIKLHNEISKFKIENDKRIDEKNKAKELILEYKTALEKKNIELLKLQKEKENLEEKYNKIPEFVRNFFEN